MSSCFPYFTICRIEGKAFSLSPFTSTKNDNSFRCSKSSDSIIASSPMLFIGPYRYRYSQISSTCCSDKNGSCCSSSRWAVLRFILCSASSPNNSHVASCACCSSSSKMPMSWMMLSHDRASCARAQTWPYANNMQNIAFFIVL